MWVDAQAKLGCNTRKKRKEGGDLALMSFTEFYSQKVCKDLISAHIEFGVCVCVCVSTRVRVRTQSSQGFKSLRTRWPKGGFSRVSPWGWVGLASLASHTLSTPGAGAGRQNLWSVTEEEQG